MKVIRELVGAGLVEGRDLPHDALHAVHHEVAPGCFMFLTLGPSGLLVTNGKDSVGVPLEALVKLAQQHEPSLIPGK